jgi:hypothetical protein
MRLDGHSKPERGSCLNFEGLSEEGLRPLVCKGTSVSLNDFVEFCIEMLIARLRGAILQSRVSLIFFELKDFSH